MLNRIQEFFNSRICGEDESEPGEEAIHLATAALLVEVMLIDGKAGASEQETVKKLLVEQLGLSSPEVENLTALAREEVDQATSLFQFTAAVNRSFNRDNKQRLIEALWRVAYADGSLDKYEEGIIRKIADLIYVSHSAFLRAKHRAAGNLH